MSCDHSLSYDYLMQHPLALKRALLRCGEEDTSACQEVRRAAEDFSELINERRQDPEKFGETILKAQQNSTDPEKIKIFYAVIAATSERE